MSSRVIALHVGQNQLRVRGLGDVRAGELPLVGEAGACGEHAESGGVPAVLCVLRHTKNLEARPGTRNREIAVIPCPDGNHLALNRGWHVGLAHRVQPPREDHAIRTQGEAVVGPGRNRHRVQAHGKIGQPVGPIAPRDQAAVRAQRQAVVSSGGDGDHMVESERHRGLAVVRGPPRDHGAVLPEREAVAEAAGHGDDVGEVGWHIRLAKAVAPPRDHRPVTPDGQIDRRPGGKGDGVGQIGRHIGLPKNIITPGPDSPARQERHRVPVPRRHRDGVSHLRRNIGLAGGVLAPGDNGTIRAQRQAVKTPSIHGDDVGNIRRHVGLAEGAGTPRGHRTRGERRLPRERAANDEQPQHQDKSRPKMRTPRRMSAPWGARNLLLLPFHQRRKDRSNRVRRGPLVSVAFNPVSHHRAIRNGKRVFENNFKKLPKD